MSPNEHSPNCRNCGAALAGEYCGRCGQREGRGDRGFAALLGELAGELFDWDSRFWRTLWPLLVRPGFLTAEYIAGRRARYVAPLRLYPDHQFFHVPVPLPGRGQHHTGGNTAAGCRGCGARRGRWRGRACPRPAMGSCLCSSQTKAAHGGCRTWTRGWRSMRPEWRPTPTSFTSSCGAICRR